MPIDIAILIVGGLLWLASPSGKPAVHTAASPPTTPSSVSHAATGPGGGAAATQIDPGHEKSFKFKALVPGIYVYHRATPMVADHIANGMYGLILVQPEGGLPPVDCESYVMQREIYTEAAFGQRGSQVQRTVP